MLNFAARLGLNGGSSSGDETVGFATSETHARHPQVGMDPFAQWSQSSATTSMRYAGLLCPCGMAMHLQHPPGLDFSTRNAT